MRASSQVDPVRRPLVRAVLAFLGGLWVLASWLLPLAFLAWAVRLTYLEGYLYPSSGGFFSDFARTATLGTDWWTGKGIFYGPIFVLEWRYLLDPGRLTTVDFAKLDFALYAVGFAATWMALVRRANLRLMIVVLALWLGHQASVEVFSNGAHLEVLELMFLSLALLFATRQRDLGAGVSLGLAIATKTLPGLLVPYLAISRQWKLLVAALGSFLVPFLVVCVAQAMSPWDAAIALVYQGGNLTKLEFTEYEYTIRADIARVLANGAQTLTDEQARLAISVHWLLAILVAGLAAAAIVKAGRIGPANQGLFFGLCSAVMLVVAPSAHLAYYVFLLPAWTAALIELLHRPFSGRTPLLWAALVLGYMFTGFDQPFFLLQRLVGIGGEVPRNWLPWHLPTLGLLLTVGLLASILATRPGPVPRPVESARRVLEPDGRLGAQLA